MTMPAQSNTPESSPEAAPTDTPLSGSSGPLQPAPPRKGAKQIIFWVLLTVFVVSAVTWLFYVPYQPHRLYRLVPDNAVFVSHHQNLAERADEVLANPLVRSLTTMAGFEMEEVDRWREDPAVRQWLEPIWTRDVLLQYVPAIGPGRDPAWVFAGWIGGHSIRWRWWLTRGRPDGFQKIRRHAGGSYWTVDTDAAPGEEHLSIGIVEGILVGAWSRDPHAVRHILDAYDGIAERATMPAETTTAPDRGWWQARNPWDSGMARYIFAIDTLHGDGIAGAVKLDRAAELPSFAATDIETISRIWGGIPFWVIGAEPDSLFLATQPYLPAPVIRIYHGLRDTHHSGPLLLALTGGEYAGTTLAISVPALNVAWPVRDQNAFIDTTRGLLDGLNAAYRWGLVLNENRVRGHTVYTVEGTSHQLYALARPDQQVAFTLLDGWVVAASHQRTLQRLLERYADPLALIEADDGGWTEMVRSGDSAGVGHIDIRAGARTIRLALRTWSLALLREDGPETRILRQRIQAAHAWLDLLETLGVIDFQLQTDPDQWTLRLEIGEP